MAGTFNPGGVNASPTLLVNATSDGGKAPTGYLTATVADHTLSGALTAATYKEMLAVSGAGVLRYCAVRAVDTTSRTLGIKIVIDGTTVYDAVCTACTAENDGLRAFSPETLPMQLPFASSLSIQIKSSLSETDKVGLLVDYYTT